MISTDPLYDPSGDGRPMMSSSDIKRAASESMREGVDIRARIHDVTLLALRRRRFDTYGMRDVVRAVTEGVTLGAEQSRTDLRVALSEAFRGMDGALTRSAEAGRSALKQLIATGKDLSDSDIKQALATMRRLEDDFLSTAGQVAETASERIRPEFRRVLDAARQSGTDTGRVAALSFTDVAQRFSIASLDVALAGLEVATELGSRFADVASGILSGIADALAQPRSDAKPRP
jgi:uncharacterized protein DUF6781